MKLARVIALEMRHRPLNVLPAVLAVAVAAGGLLGSVALLRRFDAQTEHLLERKRRDLDAQMASMNDEFRKITKRMGFNVLILPRDQDLGDFYSDNYAEKTMSEGYAERLASAKDIVTIRHLLPMLQRKIEWPEQKRRVLLIGVRGEMPWAHRSNKKPLLMPVPPGTVAVGHELHRSMGLKEGDEITLMGRTFRVGALHPEHGSIDDITLWIDLAEAQRMLSLEGRISSMMALECQCAWADLPQVRAEIKRILPDTQVVEVAGRALARAEARREAARAARAVMTRERVHRAEARVERESLVAILVPLTILAAAAVVGVLAFLNVRTRRTEIGILRALGLRTWQILAIFLGKAFIVGVAGALVGAIAVAAWAYARAPMALDALLFASVVVAAPAVTVVAAWLPALAAAHQDPAAVLREE